MRYVPVQNILCYVFKLHVQDFTLSFRYQQELDCNQLAHLLSKHQYLLYVGFETKS